MTSFRLNCKDTYSAKEMPLTGGKLVNAEEFWRPVIGYEGWYSVSNFGRVRRDMRHAGTRVGKILKGGINGWGYLHVVLSKGTSKRTTIKICKLVMDAFIGKRKEGFVKNHKNGIKTDDRLINLEYITQKENVLHAYNILGIKAVNGSRNGQSVLKEKDISAIRGLYATKEFYQRELGYMFGVHHVTISDIIRGVTWKHLKIPQIKKENNHVREIEKSRNS